LYAGLFAEASVHDGRRWKGKSHPKKDSKVHLRTVIYKSGGISGGKGEDEVGAVKQCGVEEIRAYSSRL
jgi:hypothetical protein